MRRSAEQGCVPRAKQRGNVPTPAALRLVQLVALAAVVAAGAGALSVVAADPLAGAPSLVLTNVAQIRALSAEGAERSQAVRLQGIATYSDPARSLLCVQDSSGGIFVEPGSHPLEIQSGQRVEIIGRTAGGEFEPIVKEPVARVLGPGQYPAAGRGTYGRLASGQEHGQWVRAAGTLRRAYANARGLHLELVTGGRRIHAVVNQFSPTNLGGLVGAEISVAGVCAMMWGEDPGQLVRFQLLVPDLRQVSVDKPVPPDPPVLPLQSLAAVRQLRSGLPAELRVRVRGTVTHAHPRGSCYIQEGAESLFVVGSTQTELRAGELVEVVGFPVRGVYNVALEDAVVRSLGPGTPPVPLRVAEKAADPAAVDTKLIRVRGTLLAAQADAPHPELILEANGQVVTAHWPVQQRAMDQELLQPGSVLELTGVCSMRPRAEPPEADISVLLRTPDDVALVSGPRLSQTETLAIGMLAVLAAAAGAGWLVAWNWRSQRQESLQVHAAGLDPRSFPAVRARTPAAWAVLVCGLLASVVAWHLYGVHSAHHASAVFETHVNQLYTLLRFRLEAYETVLRSARGAASSLEMGREEWKSFGEEWRAFADSLRLPDAFPGLVGLGFHAHLLAPQQQTHVEAVRAAGLAEYEIVPAGTRPEYVPTLFVEPDNEQNRRAIGVDMLADPVAAEALQRARQSGRMAMTGKLQLVQDAGQTPRASFLLFQPVYGPLGFEGWRAGRHEALAGYVSAAFRLPELLNATIAHRVPGIGFRVYDNRSPGQELVSEPASPRSAGGQPDASAAPAPFRQLKQLVFGGRTWTVAFQGTGEFEHAAHGHERWSILAAGFLLSGLLFGLLRTQGRARAHSRVLVQRVSQELEERKRAEADVRSLSADLDQRVTQRTGELAASNEALAQTAAHLRAILEHEPECVKVVSLEGRLLDLNPAGLAMIDAPSLEHVRGQSVSDLVHPDDREAFGAVHRRAALGEGGSLQFRIHTLRGAERWMESNSVPLRDAQGRIKSVLSVTRDITDRKRGEVERAALEAQLRQSQKLEAIGTLAGGIAHDFNNILGAIMGFTQVAKLDTAGQAQVHESLDAVLQSSRRARDLVNQILAFSRQEQASRHPVALGPIVKEVARLLQATLPPAIVLKVSVAPDLPLIEADATQFHQVVLNLLTNSAQAMREQGGRIEVSLEMVAFDTPLTVTLGELQPGRFLCLKVQDTGRGMDTAVTERAFDPFFTTKGPGEGVGLGLSVVHGIVKSHRGAIRLTTAPGEGATFEVFFSAASFAGADAAPPAEFAPEIPKGRGQRILFVDDEPALVNVGQRVLHELGYHVSAYSNPLEALQGFRSRPAEFDLVLTDLAMPLLNGTEFAREVLACRPDIPILMTTGLGSSVTPQNAHEFGIREILPKPAEVEQLGAAVFRALHAHPLDEAPRAGIDRAPVTVPFAEKMF